MSEYTGIGDLAPIEITATSCSIVYWFLIPWALKKLEKKCWQFCGMWREEFKNKVDGCL